MTQSNNTGRFVCRCGKCDVWPGMPPCPIPPGESVPDMLARVAAEEEAHADDNDRPRYRARDNTREGESL